MNIEQLILEIRKYEDEDKKKWWENYVKNDALFYGIPMDKLRVCLKKGHKENEIEKIDIKDQLEIVRRLFRMRYSEEKLLGILYLQNYIVKKADSVMLVGFIEELYDEGLIFDWNICDWLCVKVLSPIIDYDSDKVIEKINAWADKKDVWTARASLVSYARTKDISKYTDEMDKSMHKLIRRQERFAKTAVGWILRELSKENLRYVTGFIDKELEYMSVEVIKNSLKYFKDECKKYLNEFKENMSPQR